MAEEDWGGFGDFLNEKSDNVVQQFFKRKWNIFKLHFACFDFGKIQNIVNDGQQ